MAEGAYRYSAFISYRHVSRDRKWARWLIEKLETFRTPSALVRQGAPARIGRLFRDDDEIPASSDLSQQIEDALRASRFLIVICSPDTPQSKWVSREIEFFRSIGRGDHILALLVEGEPHKSFPPELLRVARERTLADGTTAMEWSDAEPIAADVRPRDDERRSTTERRAFLRIAAGLLGLRYDDLAQREQQRRVRRQRLQGAVAAVLAIAAGVGAYEYWDYNTLHTHYYRSYGTRWGIAFGIDEISPEMAAHRAFSYAIDTRRGHVVAMRRETGYGGRNPLDGNGITGEAWETGVAEWRFTGRGDRAERIDIYGQAVYQTSRTDAKLMSESFSWLPDGTAAVAFKYPNGGAAALQAADSVVMTSSSDAIKQRSQIALHKLQFTADGYVANRMFQTVWGGPARDANGSFGKSYDYDGQGRRIATRELNAGGHTIADQTGSSVLRFTYQRGEMVSVERRDDANKLHMGPSGYAMKHATHDRYGNITSTSYQGEDGKPVALKLGFARIDIKYDDRGNVTEETFFGARGERVKHGAWGLYLITYKYDALGHDIEDAGFGLRGEPILRTDNGLHRIARHYDDAGNEIEDDLFGIDGKPVLTTDIGSARTVFSYDEHGNETGQRYFGTDNRPILSKDRGVAALTERYDGRGMETDESYFGTDGKPILRTDMGYARQTYEYDERGNEIGERYFGTDGTPVARLDWGVARVAYQYDDQGNETEEDYFDTADRAVARKDWGVARVMARYDGHGKKVEEAYFGIDGRPATNKSNGAASLRYAYNAWGDLTETKRFDAAGAALPAKGH
jgi:YD repeat-containing protein